MKKHLLLFVVSLISFCATAQTLSAPFMNNAKKALPTPVITDTIYVIVPASTFTPKTATILLLTPSIPINFSRIQQEGSSWQVTGSVTAGLSYCFLIGRGTTLSNGSTEVTPFISVGPYVDAGGIEDLVTKGVLGSVSIGGTIGVYKYVGILLAYDLVNKNPYFGLGASISIFSFTQGNGNILLNPKAF